MNTARRPLSATAPGEAPQRPPAQPGTALEEGPYRIWAELFEQRTGVCIDRHREAFVRRELTRRLDELELDIETYLQRLAHPAVGLGEWRRLLDRLLIKETRFFRHRASHDLVRETVRRRAPGLNGASLNLWSLGCSTGEEAHALAADALTGFRDAGCPPEFAVIGTDISCAALRAARAGIYPLHALRDVDRDALAPWLEPAGTGRFHFTAELRRHVGFVADNLLEQRRGFFPEGLDIIFCQNVLVYFRRWRRHQALNFLAGRLKPGGLLIIGPGEGSDWRPEQLLRVRTTDVAAYRRPGSREDRGDR